AEPSRGRARAARAARRETADARGRAGDQRATLSHPGAQPRRRARAPRGLDPARRGTAGSSTADEAEQARARAPAAIDDAPRRDQRLAPRQAAARVALMLRSVAAKRARTVPQPRALRCVGIDQHANAYGSRLQFMQQPKLFCPKLRRNEGDTGDVAARPVETGDEAELNRVAAAYEDDRDRRSRRLGYICRDDVMSSDHRHLTAYQIGCEVGQSVVLVLRPAILDHDILALDVTGFTNALPKGGQITCTIGKRRNAEETDHRRCRLLPSRRYRPRHRCAAEQRDKLSPFHLIELHFGPHQPGPNCSISN